MYMCVNPINLFNHFMPLCRLFPNQITVQEHRLLRKHVCDYSWAGGGRRPVKHFDKVASFPGKAYQSRTATLVATFWGRAVLPLLSSLATQEHPNPWLVKIFHSRVTSSSFWIASPRCGRLSRLMSGFFFDRLCVNAACSDLGRTQIVKQSRCSFGVHMH